MMLLLLLLPVLPALLYAREFKVITYSTENAGKVRFDHEIHLKKLGNNCTVCHNSIFGISGMNPRVTMSKMREGKSCGACHNKTRAFDLSECTRCHAVRKVPIEVPRFGSVGFDHNFHLGMFGCGECHNKLFKPGPGNPRVTMSQMEKGAACGACHDGSSAFTVKDNCTKCHEVRDIAFAVDAIFSHKFHLEMYKCNDCHSKLFVAGPESRRYTMAEMVKGKSCGACHDGATGFSVKGDCDKCHKGTKEITFKAPDALFSHKFHIGMFKCADCHSAIFTGGAGAVRHTMAEMMKGKSCGACHDGKTAFTVSGSCDKCHKSTREITFDLKNAGRVTFSHNLHQGMFKCDECHFNIFTTGAQSRRYTMSEMEKGGSCGACHDGKTAFSVTNCSKCHPVKDITLADEARFSHNKHLEMYKCGDCHNNLFIAGPDNKRRTMSEMEKGASCGACHDGNTGFSVKGECDKCHKSTIEVAFKVRETGVTWFSHKLHTGMFKCGDCHNAIFTAGAGAKRYRMADMEKGNSCGACHDGKTAFTVKENCNRCHPTKEIQFKESGALFSHNFHTGMYGCNECHDRIFIPGQGNKRFTMPEMEKGLSCGACHDDKTAFTVSGNCDKCHKVTKAIQFEIPGATGNVLFSHKVHQGRGYNCADCHNKVIAAGVARRPATMKAMEEGKSCGACHGFSMAFTVKDPANCDRCHNRRPS
jgi:c(7)-type cytochrome triheme protein